MSRIRSSRPRLTHRILLRAHPRQLRDRHGDDLLDFWEAQLTEERYRGGRGRLRLAVDYLRELGGALAMRWRRQDHVRVEALTRGTVTTSSAMDVVYAMRTLRAAPIFTGVVVSTLALGIGATTAVFSVLDAVVLRPLPYASPEQLVRVDRTAAAGQTTRLGWPDFSDWREHSGTRLRMAAYAETDGTFEWPEGAELIQGALVTRDLFSVLGISPVLGRSFADDEDRLGGPNAVVLSDGLWMTRFGRDPEILGRTIPMDGELVPIVGVMPPNFAFPDARVRYWMPLQEEQLLVDVGLPTGTRTLSFLEVVARVDAAVGPIAARAELASIARAIDDEAGKTEEQRADPVLIDFRASIVGETDTTLRFLMAAVLLVLLVTCANVAGVCFTRSVARERDLAVRTALGASRLRLFGQLMAESALLAVVGGSLAIIVAVALTEAVLLVAPDGMPRLEGVGVDAASIGLAVFLTSLAGVATGLPTAWRGSRVGVARGIHGNRAASASAASLRPQHLLAGVQVSLAVVLLAAAGLLLNSFVRLTSVERGFESESVIVAGIAPNEAKFDAPEAVDAFYQALLERVRMLPGVANATTTWSPPLVGNDFRTSVAREGEQIGEQTALEAGTVIVRDGYFDTNGVRLVAGRDFDSSDRLGEPMVAIVNEAMARVMWPDEDPIGKRFEFTGGLRGSADSFDDVYFPDGYLTVVGVAGDVRRSSLAEPPVPEYYRPHAQITWAYQYMLVRVPGDPDDVAASLRDVVWSVDPTVAVDRVEMLSARVAGSVSEPRFRALLLGGFAALACILVMLGLYSVMALVVTRRTREIGIRLALGATAGGVLRSVLSSFLRLVGIGLVVGLTIAGLGSRALASMLFEVAPTDPLTYVTVAAVVVTVCALAGYVPARRAYRLDPVESLQRE